jgi:subtilisin-like proprotein convertase family protein
MDRVVLELETPGFTLSREETPAGDFARIGVPGCGRAGEVGRAALPVVRKAVEIPQGASVRVRVLEIEETGFDLAGLGYPARLYPVQEPVEKLPGAMEEAEFSFSAAYYTGESQDPPYQARVAEIGQMGGHRFAMIEVAPVSYVPSRGNLTAAGRMVVAVEFTCGDAALTREVIDRYATGRSERTASRALLNYRPPSSLGGPAPPVGYLIISDPAFLSEIQLLADWKNSKGYASTVVSTSDIPGGSGTTEIKAYIQDAWDNWEIPPSFVLLVGDVADIPNWTGTGDNSPPTDLYYATMTDPDYIPDLGIGRLSVTSSTEAENLVTKIVEYERAMFGETGWLKKAVFMASEDNYTITEGTHNYVISNYMDPAGYTSDKLYVHSESATTQQVHDAYSEGRGLGIYSGHGAVTYWDDGPHFTQTDVAGLTNPDKYPFVQSYACYTGRYTQSECFAETWIRETDKAGLGFWASSVTSYWDEDDVLEKGVFKALFQDSLTWIAGMTDQGKWYLYEYYGGEGSTRRYYEMYNLMGDPSLDVWTDVPAPMYASHTGVCPLGSSTYSVTVDDGADPVADALVCLNMPGEVYATAPTGPSGTAVLTLDPPPDTVGEMFLTVTRHGFAPVGDTVLAVVPALADVDPDSIPIATFTPVTVTVLDTLSQPIPGMVVAIDGWGLEPALVDTTGPAGLASFTVNAPYGEELLVVGRMPGDEYDSFDLPLTVTGGTALTGADIEARVDEVGLTGSLTPGYAGTLTGRASLDGLSIYALGTGVDSSASSPTDSVILEITPAGLGTLRAALARAGSEVYEEDVPVIEAYGTLAGVITATTSGDSLAGALVRGFPAGSDTAGLTPAFEAVSTSGGAYAAPGSLAVGPYDLYVSKFGYLALEDSVMIMWGSNDRDLALDPAPSGVVTGVVTETGTGEPLSAVIRIYRSDDLSLYSETTSDSAAGGGYATDPLPYFDYVFRISAQYHMKESVSLTVDEPSEVLDVELTPTEGNLLVIDDDTGDKATRIKRYGKGEVEGPGGLLSTPPDAPKAAAALAQDLEDLGYDVTTETSAGTDPLSWPDYHLVVWSSGEDVQPVSVASYRRALNSYVAGGGKLLIEGGEIGYDATTTPGYPDFADSTLHVDDWNHDSSGDLTIDDPTHPLATIPNEMPTTIPVSYSGYGDQDALVPLSGNHIVFDWSSYPSQAGVLVYDDNPNPAASQVVFFTFDYSNVTDTTARRDLLENAVSQLLAEENPPEAAVSGTVHISGQPDNAGAVVTAYPGEVSDTTDESGWYMIEGLYTATYTLTATKAGYSDSTREVTITGPGTVEDIDFSIFPVYTYTDSPGISIPDNDAMGITAYLDVTDDIEIGALDCFVDISHSFRGDLIVELTSPEGTAVRLHNQSGGSANDISTWYDAETAPDGPGSMDDFWGEPAIGTWELWVSDNAFADNGILNQWSLSIALPPEVASAETEVSGLPETHFLDRGYPNPFGDSATLRFGLPRSQQVELAVFDVRGRRVRVLARGSREAGVHTVIWDGRDDRGRPSASGVYFCRLHAGRFSREVPLLLLR